jgi:glycosyltransferase involved in cell wall biosynthesis
MIRPQPGHPLLAVLVKRFPRLSETFILNEFLELRRRGLPARLFAIMDPHESQSQPEALALLPEVTYLQPGTLLGQLRRAARAARHHPWGALKAAGWVATRHSKAAVRNYLHALTLVSYLDEEGFVHLHAHFAHSPAAIAFIANKINGIRYSVTGHAKDIYTTLAENLAMRSHGAVFVTTCTEANRRHLIHQTGLDPGKVLLCRHGVDLERFARLARTPQAGRILSVGRLVPKKGFDILLRACALLAATGRSFELRMFGGGELRGDLEAQAHDLGIDDRVHIGGGRPQTELLAEFSAAELFVLSPVVLPDGDRDGLPNVIREAMAAGLPVVTSSVSGVPEVIEHGRTGLLVPPGDPQALADAAGTLLTDAELRRALGQAAQAFAVENFGLETSVEPLLDRFQELIGGTAQDARDR